VRISAWLQAFVLFLFVVNVCAELSLNLFIIISVRVIMQFSENIALNCENIEFWTCPKLKV
jgi:hypothetical protein